MTGKAQSALRPETPKPRSLEELAAAFDLEVRGDIAGDAVTGVSIASGAVEPGDLYVGVPGRNAHGASYASAAREAGAVALLTDEAGAEVASESGIPAS